MLCRLLWLLWVGTVAEETVSQSRSLLSARRLSAGACVLGRTTSTDLDFVWNDDKSGANSDVSIWRPKPITIGSYTYRPLGDVAHGSKNKMNPGQLLVGGDVVSPIGFHKVWDDNGSGAEHDFSAWRAIAPPGYRCIGDVGSGSKSGPPPASSFACIPSSCANAIGKVGARIWTDKGTGANTDFSMYELPIAPGYFVTHHDHGRSGVHISQRIKIADKCFPTGGLLQEPCGSFASEAACPQNGCKWDGACQKALTLDTYAAVGNSLQQVVPGGIDVEASRGEGVSNKTSCKGTKAGCNLDYVRKFAPILLFDKTARSFCFPSNAGDNYAIRKAGHTEMVCNTDEYALRNGEVETYYEYDECGLDPNNPSQITVILYWWWYGYQKPCINHLVKEGDHPGDWERVSVLIVDGRLRRVQYWQHSGKYTVGAFEIWETTHPVVYVGKIAHGSYHNPGGIGGTLGLACMYFQDSRDPGANPYQLKTWENLRYIDRVNGPEWMSAKYQRKYLEDTSPPYQRNTSLCKLLGCEGTDNYQPGDDGEDICLGESCGCGRSCIGETNLLQSSLDATCPTEPVLSLNWLQAMITGGTGTGACRSLLTIFIAFFAHASLFH